MLSSASTNSTSSLKRGVRWVSFVICATRRFQRSRSFGEKRLETFTKVEVLSISAHSSISESVNQQSQPFKDRKATIVAQTLASHNLPTNKARELIKHSTDSASLRLEIEKKVFRLGFWVLCVLRHSESMFVHFWRLCLALGPSSMRTSFRSMFFFFCICDSKTSL